MKNRLFSFFLFCVLLLSLTSCGSVPTSSLMDSYDLVSGSPYVVDDTFTFYPITYKDVNTHLLGYSSDLELGLEESSGYIKSLLVGKECISITGSILDLQATANKKILLDLLNRLNLSINGPDSKISIYNKDVEQPYIISSNSNGVFIDYITTIPNVREKVIYYRVIIQDVRNVTPSLTASEYSSLPSNLVSLKSFFGIVEDFDLVVSADVSSGLDVDLGVGLDVVLE